MRTFEKLSSTAIMPQRATRGSAGYDLYANEDVLLEPGKVSMVKTGVTFRTNFWSDVLLIHIRSSWALKYGLLLANGVGVVDADYFPNEIGVLIYNSDHLAPFMVHKGDKIAQAIIQTYWLAKDDVPVNVERTGGFGSTGK